MITLIIAFFRPLFPSGNSLCKSWYKDLSLLTIFVRHFVHRTILYLRRLALFIYETNKNVKKIWQIIEPSNWPVVRCHKTLIFVNPSLKKWDKKCDGTVTSHGTKYIPNKVWFSLFWIKKKNKIDILFEWVLKPCSANITLRAKKPYFSLFVIHKYLLSWLLNIYCAG